jgi:hypothetical protein
MIEPGEQRVKLSEAERATIRALLHQRELAPRLRERLEMVKAADLGADLHAIARWSERALERALAGDGAALAGTVCCWRHPGLG